MESLKIPSTKVTPLIHFNVHTRIFEISGESYSMHHRIFYNKIVDWLEQYLTTTSYPVTFNFRLLYFNNHNRRSLMYILQILENIQMENAVIKRVNWCIDAQDESMQEIGEGYQEDFQSLPLYINVQS